MQRSKRLLPLLNLAERKEQDAAAVMAKSQQSLKEYENKLAMMREYRNEYANDNGSGSLSAGLLRDKQAFIKQIDQAIELLEQQLQQHTSEHNRVQKDWFEAKQKTNVMDKVIDKFRISEDKLKELREQREVDDLVNKRKSV